MRSLLVVCGLTALAYAEPAGILGARSTAQPLPVDVVSQAKVGDWALYEGQRLEGGKLVADRVVARVVKSDSKTTQTIVWSRGAKDHEAEFYRYASNGAASTELVDKGIVADKVAVIAGKCAFDAKVDCKIATFVSGSPMGGDQTDKLTMATTVRATGIVALEIGAANRVTWQLQVVAYGHDDKTDWAEPKDAQWTPLTADVPTGPDTHGLVPSIAVGDLKVSAGLDQATVHRYLRRNEQKLRYCYDKQLAAKPKLHGQVVVTLSIGADGLVASAAATGMDGAAAACMVDVVRGIEFPKPKGDKPVSVSCTLSFTASKP